MTQQSLKSKTCLVILLVLVLAPLAFGEEDTDYAYVVSEEVEAGPQLSATSTTPRGPRTPEEITRELNESQAARNLLNRTLSRMQRRMERILHSAQSPVPAPSVVTNNTNNSSMRGARGLFKVEKNAELIQKLEREIQALKNPITVSPVVLNSGQAASPVDLPALQTEVRDLSARMVAIQTQNEQNSELLRGNLANLTQDVKEVLTAEKMKKRQQLVKDVLQAFENSQTARVHSLLNELRSRQSLDLVIAEIVRGMFNGSVDNYPKIIDVFKSAGPRQYRLGFASLIDLFHSSPIGEKGTLSLVERSQYLNLAHVAKEEFETDFKDKFPRLVQNLGWNPKSCISNAMTNLFLFMDQAKGLQDGGYPVTTKRKPQTTSGVYCDWEFLPLSESSSFIIRQNVSNTKEGSFINLNILNGLVYVGTNVHNQHHLWKIQLRNDSKALTIQSIPASSDNPAFFLCSASRGAKHSRALELKADGKEKYCSWFIELPA